MFLETIFTYFCTATNRIQQYRKIQFLLHNATQYVFKTRNSCDAFLLKTRNNNSVVNSIAVFLPLLAFVETSIE